MRRWSLFGGVMLAVCLTIAGFGAAQAQVLEFSSFGTNYTNVGVSDCISGADSPGCFTTGPELEWVAAPFSLIAPGKLDFIFIGASYHSGTNGVIVTLVDDNGGSPSPTTNVLETFYVAKLPTSTKPKVKLTSKLNPFLTTGHTYWLFMQPVGYDGLDYWYLGPQSPAPDLSGDGGNTWVNYGNAAPYTNTPTLAVYVQ